MLFGIRGSENCWHCENDHSINPLPHLSCFFPEEFLLLGRMKTLHCIHRFAAEQKVRHRRIHGSGMGFEKFSDLAKPLCRSSPRVCKQGGFLKGRKVHIDTDSSEPLQTLNRHKEADFSVQI